jgi:hypothetical protein
MSERIIMLTGEALVAAGPPGTAAEPNVIIGKDSCEVRRKVNDVDKIHVDV